MEKNQNDKRNQQSGSKSQLEKFEDGTKKKETNPSNPTAKKDHQPGSQQGNYQEKKETNPANPTAKQGHQPDSQQGNYQEKSPTSTQNKSNSNIQDSDEREEELTDSTTSSKSRNKDTKKGNF